MRESLLEEIGAEIGISGKCPFLNFSLVCIDCIRVYSPLTLVQPFQLVAAPSSSSHCHLHHAQAQPPQHCGRREESNTALRASSYGTAVITIPTSSYYYTRAFSECTNIAINYYQWYKFSSLFLLITNIWKLYILCYCVGVDRWRSIPDRLVSESCACAFGHTTFIVNDNINRIPYINSAIA